MFGLQISSEGTEAWGVSLEQTEDQTNAMLEYSHNQQAHIIGTILDIITV